MLSNILSAMFAKLLLSTVPCAPANVETILYAHPDGYDESCNHKVVV